MGDRKKKKEAELEEAERELEAIAAGNEPVTDVKSDTEDAPKDTKSKKKKDKKKKNKADDSDEEDTGEMETKPIVKKSGFAAFQMDNDSDDEDDHAVDSDEAPVITKAPEPKKKTK